MDSNKGWWVTASGLGLNLALGVLYAWSVFAKQLTETVDKGGFGWTKTEASIPYTVAIACFAMMMVPAGRLQDKIGPRMVASMGAVFTAAGLVFTSFASAGNILPAVIGFGVLAGTGFGLGYSAATPAAVKWFPPEKKGLITGIVVSGFGLAPVYIAPFSKYLIQDFGVSDAFRVLGAVFAVFAVFIAQFITNPPLTRIASLRKNKVSGNSSVDFTWRDMLRTRTFYFLWFEYACAATAGLMIIGHLAKIVSVQSGNVIRAGFLFVILLAVFNAAGRIIAGIVSDRIGRIRTIMLVFISQAAIMFFFSKFSTVETFILGSAVVGFSYGACLSLFPSATADFWGTKNLGLNYGIMFTAWGVGGVFGPIMAGKIADMTGSYSIGYLISSALLIIGAFMTFFTKAPARKILPAKETDVVLEGAEAVADLDHPAAYKVRYKRV
ncbi:MAG TPA: OFA family MFS transporter [Candidatus Sulfobium mesophilum]|nr:OFA family MFS transporter [Candidatus Sulfobium mesophilum]